MKFLARNNRLSKMKILMILGLMTLLLDSCDTDNKKRGYEYYPDMAYSEAYETYSPNPVFKDGKTAQHPVAGTIPRHMVPHQYPKTREGMKAAGENLINPIDNTPENLERGKFMYEIFCANCHGFDGTGDGNLYVSGKYSVEPPSLISERLAERPDGEYYHIITIGSSIMGPFGAMIRPEDRWKIILYIKNELNQENANTEM